MNSPNDLKNAADRILSPLDRANKWLSRVEMIAVVVIALVSWLGGRFIPLPSETHQYVTAEGVVLSEKTVESPDWLLSVAIFAILLFLLAFWAVLRDVREKRSSLNRTDNNPEPTEAEQRLSIEIENIERVPAFREIERNDGSQLWKFKALLINRQEKPEGIARVWMEIKSPKGIRHVATNTF
ncbi:MAG: hypothetical protein HQ477_13120 [Chloroflexi bacterium]|nr:hypothetical protein [Chloroflexota bacterium]